MKAGGAWKQTAFLIVDAVATIALGYYAVARFIL